MALFVAVIGDIIDSRKLENRYSVQEKLKSVLEEINRDYQDVLASSFSLTLGDEFQGLMVSPLYVLELLDMITCKMHPVRIRYGIGIGDMYTRIQRENSMGSDGPAYWLARDAIRHIHDDNDYGNTTIRIESDCLPSAELDLVNATLRACDAIAGKWMASQKAFICRLIPLVKHNRFQQVFAAKELGLKPQEINSKIQSTSILPYLQAKAALRELLVSLYTQKAQAEERQAD